jgi:hypothetical protein
MIAEIRLIYRGKEVPLPLSLRLMLLFEYLARTSYLGQNARQIAAGLSGDIFTRQHGSYATRRKTLRFDVSRTAVKQQISRLRAGLGKAFKKAGLHLNPERVVISESTVTNEVRHKLKAAVTWVHEAE